MAAEWLVHRINAYNNGTGYIPGVKIGKSYSYALLFFFSSLTNFFIMNTLNKCCFQHNVLKPACKKISFRGTVRITCNVFFHKATL